MTTLSGAARPAPAARLARQLHGRVTGPNSPDCDTARRPWNLRVDQRPLVIADAEGPDDITATVAYAARHGLQVTVQATVHGAGGSMENAILLHTSGLREVTVDPGQQRVRVGSGIRTSDVLTALARTAWPWPGYLPCSAAS